MGQDLAKKTFSTTPEYFIAGTAIGITTAVKEAGADLKAHTPVILNAEGKVAAVVKSGDTVNVEGIYGITTEEAANGEDTVIYLTGEFFGDEVKLESGVTLEDVEIALRNIGIFLK